MKNRCTLTYKGLEVEVTYGAGIKKDSRRRIEAFIDMELQRIDERVAIDQKIDRMQETVLGGCDWKES